MTKLLLLGASGSIGKQTLEVMKENPNDFSLEGFSVGHNISVIDEIIKDHPEVKMIYMIEKEDALSFKERYPSIKFFFGDQLTNIVNECDYEMMVNALVGFVGLVPTVKALERNKEVALANKESLVVGGDIINNLLKEGKGKIYPIDSEHSAIYKCLHYEGHENDVNEIILTASGGPFRDLSREELEDITVEDALNHPTWSMGKKITIDSATMVNKCFEIIEAYYLYGFGYEDIKVMIERTSHVHSLVKTKDNKYFAEISKPSMKNPIRYALYKMNGDPGVNVYSSLEDIPYSLVSASTTRYPALKYAELVIKNKGTFGAILNAANEEAVYAFLDKKISFLDIEKIIGKILNTHINIAHPNIEDILLVDINTRKKVQEMITKGDYR